MIKLSDCKKYRMFFYDGEIVGYNYIMDKVEESKLGNELKAIWVYTNQEQLDEAISRVLCTMWEDEQSGIERDGYSLGKLDTELVEVDK